MLQKDVLAMTRIEWEPRIPSCRIIQAQIAERYGRVDGNVRLASQRIAGGSHLSFLITVWLGGRRLSLLLRGKAHELCQRLKYL